MEGFTVAEKAATETDQTVTSVWDELRKPFPPDRILLLPKPTKADNQKGSCGVCGGYHGLPAVHLDYVSHADVTDRLLAVDPYWNWEPLSFDEKGQPVFVMAGAKPVGLWIKLTVHTKPGLLGATPVTRLGFGSVAPNAFDAEKQLIGDAIRNAAMRFGVALDLWRKGLDSDLDEVEPAPPRAPARTQPAKVPAQDATLSDRITDAVRVLREEGIVTARMVELLKDLNVGPGKRVGALTLKEQIHLLAELLKARRANEMNPASAAMVNELDALLKTAIETEGKQ